MSKIDGELLQRAIHVLEDEGEVSDQQFFLIKNAIKEWHKFKSALEWYADDKNYDVYEINTEEQGIIVMTEYWTNVTKDEGKRARQTLKGESK